MPLLNFQRKFVPAIETGLTDPDHPCAKRQTIRARRKDCRNPQPGQTLHLYTGLRTQYCRKIGEVECKRSVPIAIENKGKIFIGISELTLGGMLNLAHKDGFQDYFEFIEFFEKNHGFPFYGFLITW